MKRTAGLGFESRRARINFHSNLTMFKAEGIIIELQRDSNGKGSCIVFSKQKAAISVTIIKKISFLSEVVVVIIQLLF